MSFSPVPGAHLLLRTLAEQLPDDMLQRIFPESTPKECKKTLFATASQLDTGRKPSSIAVPKNPGKRETLTLFTDGASRGNPGDAAAGFTIVDHTGSEVVGGGRFLGKATNNVAEYQALILGLHHALTFSPKTLAIRLDSELAVKQIRGEYKVRHPDLIPLFTEVKGMLARFPAWTIAHVPRAQNKRADQLANQAIDNQWRETTLVHE